MVNSYNAIVMCENCGVSCNVTIESSIRTSAHLRLKSEPCENCGFRLKKITD